MKNYRLKDSSATDEYYANKIKPDKRIIWNQVKVVFLLQSNAHAHSVFNVTFAAKMWLKIAEVTKFIRQDENGLNSL